MHSSERGRCELRDFMQVIGIQTSALLTKKFGMQKVEAVFGPAYMFETTFSQCKV